MSRSHNRRVSLPAISPNAGFSKGQANINEAKGLIAEMLTSEEISPRVISGLKAINNLLSSPHVNAEHIPSIAENPVTGEQICIPQKSQMYRMSTLIWSTVTSATGLPTFEPEPSRSRSSSFWKKKSVHEDPSPRVQENEDNKVFKTKDGYTFDTSALEEDLLLAQLPSWKFPIFQLEQRSPRSLLSEAAFRIFKKMELFRIFRLPCSKFFNFFHTLELGYWNIPYHNRTHAADVLQATYSFSVQKCPAISEDDDKDYTHLSQVLSSLELMALFTAAAMHDYDHPGRTNAFLVATRDPKAILYNDRSVLENHHAASAWNLLMQTDNNFLDGLDSAEYGRFRFMVLELILCTDLKRHFDIIAEFNSKVKSDEGLNYDDESDKLLICEMLIKMADINSPTRCLDTHREWTRRVVEEFYCQGDDEKSQNIPLSAYMDRNHPSVAKLQDSFIAHLVSPLALAISDAGLLPVPDGHSKAEVVSNLESNHSYWLDEIENVQEKQNSLGTIQEQEGDDAD